MKPIYIIGRKTIDRYRCQRCNPNQKTEPKAPGHVWWQDPNSKGPPKTCPNPLCKNIYWQKPRQTKKAAESRRG